MSNKKLRKRLKKFVKAIDQTVESGDPLDSEFFHGYDQALGNTSWALKRMLEATK